VMSAIFETSLTMSTLIMLRLSCDVVNILKNNHLRCQAIG
jgi:hypothetical protein